MNDRLTSIVTRTGDDGTTGLGDGSRTLKCSARINTIGQIDELNSSIGVLLTEDVPESVQPWLMDIQHTLFDLGSELAVPGYQALFPEHIQTLEGIATFINDELSSLQDFILPGGSKAAAFCHLSRAICRRVEREAVALAQEETVSPTVLRYLNRLSDLLFILARYLNTQTDTPDVLWQKNRKTA